MTTQIPWKPTPNHNQVLKRSLEEDTEHGSRLFNIMNKSMSNDAQVSFDSPAAHMLTFNALSDSTCFPRRIKKRAYSNHNQLFVLFCG